jgi:hypothetical protein
MNFKLNVQEIERYAGSDDCDSTAGNGICPRLVYVQRIRTEVKMISAGDGNRFARY